MSGGSIVMLKSLVDATRRLGQRVVRFVDQIWADHQELLASNPTYRRKLEAGAVAVLGACALHPTAALVATVALSVYIAAHETGSPGWRPGYDGPVIRRPDDPDRDF
jgi:hypothetical protein